MGILTSAGRGMLGDGASTVRVPSADRKDWRLSASTPPGSLRQR